MMNTPHTILVPIDFSEGSTLALEYAVTLAKKLDAKLHLLNVVFFPVMTVPEVAATVPQNLIDSLVTANLARLRGLADARRDKATIGEVLVHIGDPRDVILQAVETLGADLIVMATHGRRGLRRALLGSVAELVVRTATCPVLTVRVPAK